MILLSDGTVMAQQYGVTKNWYRLTPDSTGSYANGAWTQLTSMSLERQFYPSNVLPSGNVFVEGGEYSGPQGQMNLTNAGEMYNPVTNSWSAMATFPLSNFGDDPTELLPDGRVLAGYIFGPQTYIYNPLTNAWSFAANKLRSDRSDEETWIKLPDNSILSYDIFASTDSQVFHAQRYIPAQNQWVDASALDPANPPGQLSRAPYYELGGAFLLPDRRVFVLGDTGRTAFYNPSTGRWSAGPNIPDGDTAGDEPGAVMPDGNVLFTTNGSTMRHAFVFHPATNTYTDVTPSNYSVNHTYPYMLMLPSGDVLVSNTTNQLAVYTPDTATGLGRPGVLSIAGTGTTLNLTGTRLNGISEGASFGDDAEMSTNYPLVRFYYLSGLSFNVAYARTFNWSSTGVSSDFATVTTQFTMPSFFARGIYLMDVVANGIASPLVLNVQMTSSTDNLVIRNNPSNSANVQIVSGSTVLLEVALSVIGSIRVSCDANADTLTVDYHYGNPVPGGGIDYAEGPGVDTLNVTDQFSNSSQTFYLTSTGIQRAGSAAITFLNYGINHVNLYGGSGNNTYDVESTEPFYAAAIDTGSGTDTVTVKTTNLGSSLAVNTTSGAGGNGNNQVTIGNFGSVAGIQGAVTILNVPNYDHLTLDDSADSVNHSNVTIGSSGITGLAPAAINFTAASVNSLTVSGGTGTNSYTIAATPVEFSHSMTLNTGSGADTVRVQANSVALTVDTLSGNDNSNSNVTIGNAGSLAGIGAPVTIHNGPGYDTVTIDDSADSASHSAVTVSSNGVTGLAPNPLNFTSVSVRALTINGGTGTNGYTIAATPVPSFGSMTLNTGSGPDTVRVQANFCPVTVATLFGDSSTSSNVTIGNAGSLAGIGAAVAIANVPGYDTVTIDDSADSGSHSAVTVNSGGVLGLAPNPVTFSGASVKALTINGGTGTNSYTVAATPVASFGSMVLNTGLGGNSVNIQGTTVPLTINTGFGDAVNITGTRNALDPIGAVTVNDSTATSVVTVDDSGYGGNDSYVVTNSTVTIGRAGTFSLTYSGISALTLNGGPGSDVFYIDSTSAATTVNAGGGGNIFRISPFTQWLAASIGGPSLTLNGGSSDVLEFFDGNDPNVEGFNFDAVPMSLTLGGTGTDVTDFFGMGGGVYVETNGFSNENDASGTVIFDPSGGPPSGSEGGPLASTSSRSLALDGALAVASDAATNQVVGADGAGGSAHPRAASGELPDLAELIDTVHACDP